MLIIVLLRIYFCDNTLLNIIFTTVNVVHISDEGQLNARKYNVLEAVGQLIYLK